MIESLEGTLTRKGVSAVVVEVGGVGFLVYVPLSTLSALPGEKQRVRLLTHLHVREDEIKLFGFATEPERDLFEKLLEVNRVGPTVALHVLSSCSVEDFRRYVAAGDAKTIATLVKGVGKKTAQRLVLELRGELAEPGAEDDLALDHAEAADVVKVLVSLGETPANARKRVKQAVKKVGPDADREALLQEALSG